MYQDHPEKKPPAKLMWSDQADPEFVRLAKTTPGRCDYCNGKAVKARTLCLPDTPARYVEKGEAWKGPVEKHCHLSFPVEFCAECENRFGGNPLDPPPIPFHIVEILCDSVKAWHTEEFDGELDLSGEPGPEDTLF